MVTTGVAIALAALAAYGLLVAKLIWRRLVQSRVDKGLQTPCEQDRHPFQFHDFLVSQTPIRKASKHVRRADIAYGITSPILNGNGHRDGGRGEFSETLLSGFSYVFAEPAHG